MMYLFHRACPTVCWLLCTVSVPVRDFEEVQGLAMKHVQQ